MFVIQLNVKGLTTAKLDIIRQLADSNKAAVVLLQETHCTADDHLKLQGYVLAGSTHSQQHGLASFIHRDMEWSVIVKSKTDSNIEWLITRVQDTTVNNIYKPTPLALSTTSFPHLLHQLSMQETSTANIQIGVTTTQHKNGRN